MAKILAVCISKEKGTAKINVGQAEMIENHGLKGDAHAGNWHRQVSLLSYEKIEDFKKTGVDIDDGAFGENLIVEGIDLPKLPIGTKFKINEVEMEVTQIGKECHSHCRIYDTVGDCIMPREGIFAKVLKGGIVSNGDEVKVIEN
ncbi:MOSC domain-containing protein [Clostridium sp. ZS2-4]|uniref:MOSC domain-containing protein n=1 Tax=Clostridium sp. ZS2-4 TaxID=2987703 RepID=UPI00227B39BC|nr:MOSC domain-containing protein [Clostridium sp. ZS2-4]MCY6353791.1 MOSC domain-containing protein [Clostridium sp. ZS2-4]